ncbi:MAG: type VI secretion system protein TssA [Betaproteobacteria bacterium]
MIRQEWLQPVAGEAPCGPNLEYEQDFLALEQAARGKEEQQYGDTVIPSEAPDWGDVVERASTLLDRSRDLRIVQQLTRGLTATEGLAGLRDGLKLASDLLASFWEPLHPQLVFDGEPDPVMRANALTSYADAEGMVIEVRSALFFASSLGKLTVRDVERILDPNAPLGEQPISGEQLRSVIRDAITADNAALDEAKQCLGALDGILATVAANGDAMPTPDFSALRSVLTVVAGLAGDIRAEILAPADGGVAGEAGAGGVVGVGAIRTRADAVRALDHVCDFLAHNEPTNPAPLLIRRAQRIMTMPFMDIIRELAPEAAGQVQNITGASAT